jgi:hypothetical protein
VFGVLTCVEVAIGVVEVLLKAPLPVEVFPLDLLLVGQPSLTPPSKPQKSK